MGFRVFEPTKLAGMEVRNRFMRSATHDATADVSGAVTDVSIKLHEDLAAGGVGFIVTGHAFISLSLNGKSDDGQYGIHCDEMIPGMRRLAEAMHKHGAKAAVQINHAAKTSPYLHRAGQIALAPSVAGRGQAHREMTEDEIEAVLDAYAAAAVRVREAGFDAVQFHGAHGYLMSLFLSPLTNQREDKWGGSLENRYRFHVEAVKRVRSAVGPDFPVMMKYGVLDDHEGGVTVEEGIVALKAIAAAGLDMVEISGGVGGGRMGPVRAINDDVTEMTYYRERTAKVKRAVDIPVALVGGVRCVETAEDILASGDADFVAVSRPVIREPAILLRWQAGDVRRAKCLSCNKCSARFKGQILECGEERRIREEQKA